MGISAATDRAVESAQQGKEACELSEDTDPVLRSPTACTLNDRTISELVRENGIGYFGTK